MLRDSVVGVVLAGVFAGAYAANWDSIYAAPARTIWVDRDTLMDEHPIIHATLRIKLSKPFNPGDVFYDERIVQLNLECATWQYAITSETKWLHGKLVKQWKGDTDYMALDSDKPLADAARALCNKSYGAVQARRTVET